MTWIVKELGDLVKLNYGKSLPERSRVFGNVPVYGSNGLVGYHNEQIINMPGIIVGRKGSAGEIHYSSQPFCPIDTTFYITQNDINGLDLRFCYFALKKMNLKLILGDVGVPGLNREMAYKELLLYPVDISEQRKIAAVLSTMQKAIETQTNLIERTTELKKAMMHKLFTEGTRGEKQKMTEIGLLPESWEVVELGRILEDTSPVNIKEEGDIVIKYIDVSSISRDRLCIESTEEYILKNAPDRARKKVISGDVIFATVRPTLKRVAFINDTFNNQICSTAFCVLRGKKEESKKFIYYLIQRENFIRQLAIIQSGASYPAVTDRQVKSQLIPLPCLAEQTEVANYLSVIDQKIDHHTTKKQKLEDLFHTLL